MRTKAYEHTGERQNSFQLLGNYNNNCKNLENSINNLAQPIAEKIKMCQQQAVTEAKKSEYHLKPYIETMDNWHKAPLSLTNAHQKLKEISQKISQQKINIQAIEKKYNESIQNFISQKESHKINLMQKVIELKQNILSLSFESEGNSIDETENKFNEKKKTIDKLCNTLITKVDNIPKEHTIQLDASYLKSAVQKKALIEDKINRRRKSAEEYGKEYEESCLSGCGLTFFYYRKQAMMLGYSFFIFVELVILLTAFGFFAGILVSGPAFLLQYKQDFSIVFKKSIIICIGISLSLLVFGGIYCLIFEIPKDLQIEKNVYQDYIEIKNTL
jgi:hypothetical protein